MSSSSKTGKLNLNQWQGADSPKRADFNGDNLIIDNVLGTHVADMALHLTPSEKAYLTSGACVSGTYVGDGETDQTINLGFTPKGVFVANIQRPLIGVDFANKHVYAHAGAAVSIYGTLGISIVTGGFKVIQASAPIGDNYIQDLNRLAARYIYIAFK